MRAIKVYCPPGVEPPLYAFIDALDGKLKAIARRPDMLQLRNISVISLQRVSRVLLIR